jgi:transposase InsO family protein
MMTDPRQRRFSPEVPERAVRLVQQHQGDHASQWAATINGLYKAEVIHRWAPWKSFEAVELATLEWVDWFNHRRLMEPIGNIPPAEAEERYHAMLEQPALAA